MTSELVEIIYSTGNREWVTRDSLYYNWGHKSWVHEGEDGKRYWVRPTKMLDPLRKK